MVSLGTPLENREAMKPPPLIEINPNTLGRDVDQSLKREKKVKLNLNFFFDKMKNFWLFGGIFFFIYAALPRDSVSPVCILNEYCTSIMGFNSNNGG